MRLMMKDTLKFIYSWAISIWT